MRETRFYTFTKQALYIGLMLVMKSSVLHENCYYSSRCQYSALLQPVSRKIIAYLPGAARHTVSIDLGYDFS